MKDSTPRASCADLKSALVGALKLAEIGVDGLPIPGVKGCISGILKIIEQEELREANITTFKCLVDKITQFERMTVERLSKERNASENLRSDVERLAKKLNDIPDRYNGKLGKQTKMGRLKDFFSAKGHAEVLNSLGEDLKNAMDEFQTALLVNLQVLSLLGKLSIVRGADVIKQLADMKRESDRLIDKLLVERKAFYNAHREHPIELCEHETRVSLLEEVANWAKDTSPDQPRILWMHGRAGAGKSTVAKTIAAQFDAEKTLGGSFMFSKPNGVTDGGKLCATLAYQLSHYLPEFRDHLATTIRNNESSLEAEIPQQFKNILDPPLSQLQSPPVSVIIVDALDECSPETLKPMLTSIVEITVRLPFLRLIITSRPEHPIRHILQRYTGFIHEMDISALSASEDISKYLRARLSNVYSQIMAQASQDQIWPADKDVESLVNMANNLFIFAATAVRFIGDERVADPQRRLEAILRGSYVGQKNPFSNLDIMYREILRNALPEGEGDLHERFQTIVGTIVFSFEPQSVNSLVEFLAPKYNASDIRNSLRYLNSVIIVPQLDDKMGLQVYHKSFEDFVTDPARCTLTEGHLCPATHHARLCIRHLELAKFMLDTLLAEYLQMDLEPWIKTHQTAFTNMVMSLSRWLAHFHHLKKGEIMGHRAEEALQLAQDIAEAFLEATRTDKRLVDLEGRRLSPTSFQAYLCGVAENLLQLGMES